MGKFSMDGWRPPFWPLDATSHRLDAATSPQHLNPSTAQTAPPTSPGKKGAKIYTFLD